MDIRGISEDWIVKVLESPDWIEPDPTRPGNMLAFGRVPEFGNRLLRVVYHDGAEERRIITAFFDRGRARRETAL